MTKKILIILIIGILGLFCWQYYQSIFSNPVEIFALTDTDSLITVSGTLTVERTDGGANYLLLLDNGKLLYLSLNGLDSLLGTRASVTGYLYQESSITEIPYLYVTNLETL